MPLIWYICDKIRISPFKKGTRIQGVKGSSEVIENDEGNT